jgi:aromatic ring-opening dioxygenase catalytic subunit (LigB family)
MAFAKSARALQELPGHLPARPKAILAVSGHWEENDFTVGNGKNPPMIYDYSGFPEHTYSIKYAAPGQPAVAERASQLLKDAGINCGLDSAHGFDHGIFVPLVLMYPEADVPVVPLSLKSNYSPADHIRAGEALRPLRDEGVLILGSGLSYHNMRGFRSGGAEVLSVSEKFEAWLTATVGIADAAARNARLANWESAPSARDAHPREDHLLPMMLVSGAAGDGAGRRIFSDKVFDVFMASYQFDG